MYKHWGNAYSESLCVGGNPNFPCISVGGHANFHVIRVGGTEKFAAFACLICRPPRSFNERSLTGNLFYTYWPPEG